MTVGVDVDQLNRREEKRSYVEAAAAAIALNYAPAHRVIKFACCTQWLRQNTAKCSLMIVTVSEWLVLLITGEGEEEGS